MVDTVTLLITRVRSFKSVMDEELSSGHGDSHVSQQLAKSYNELRNQIATAVPAIASHLPQPIDLAAGHFAQLGVTFAKPIDLKIYVRTMLDLLEEVKKAGTANK